MKSISLLPAEYRKLKKANRKTEIAMVVTGIITMVIVFAFVIIKILSSIPELELETVKAENELLLNNIAKLSYLTDLENDMKGLGNLAQKAVGNQPDWLSLFTNIGLTAPEGLQITNLSTEETEKGNVLAIEGIASSHAGVVLWIERLKNTELISNIELVYSQVSTDNGISSSVKYKLNVKIIQDKPFKLFKEPEQ